MDKWKKFGIDLATLVGSMSKDPSTQVGAYICDEDKRVVSMGYNGPPRGIDDQKWQQMDRQKKLAATIHAERNAILFARRDLTGTTLYVTRPPCGPCAADIVQAKIKKVVYQAGDENFMARWGTEGLEILKDGGVELEEF